MNENVTLTKTQGLSDLSRLPTSKTIENVPDCNGYLGSKSMTLEKRLEDWIFQRCADPQPRRVGELNAIFRDIYSDPRFLRYRDAKNPDDYEDALSLMWQYFLRNLCEVNSARKRASLALSTFWWKWYLKIQNDQPIKFERIELWFISIAFYIIEKPRSFNQTRHYALGRLLINLKGRIKSIQIRRKEEEDRKIQPKINENGMVEDPTDVLPAPKPNLALLQFEKFLMLLELDPAGELNNKANTLHGKKVATQEPYTLTAQTYLLMRYRDDITIQEIADKLAIPRGALQGGGGKPAKWKELARKYAQMAIDSVQELGG